MVRRQRHAAVPCIRNLVAGLVFVVGMPLVASRADAAPGIGVAKRVLTGPTNNSDGTYTLTYRIRVQNSGDETLNNVQVVDDLAATFVGSDTFVPTFALSSDFLLNPGYDGASDANVLAGFDVLGPGTSGTIDITVTVTPGAKLGAYDNVAVASAVGQISAWSVNDASTNGAIPDANGNGDPTDDSVPTSVTFTEAPQIGATKQLVSGPTNNGDGTYALGYQITVYNSGDVPVHGVQIHDDLDTTFPGVGDFVVDAISSPSLTVNPFFDGALQDQLLWGIDALPVGASGRVDVSMTITPSTQLGPHDNIATASATSAGGQALSDASTQGSDPDPNANGDPSDDAVPVSVTFSESPEVGLAKSLHSGPVNNGDGTYTLSYRFHVSSSGDTRVDDLQIEDDLASAFAGVTAFAVDAISSNRFTVDPTFDGNAQRNLLSGANSLNAGDSGTVDVTLTVTPGSTLGPHENSAILSATSAAGAVLMDTSTLGVTPDANGNGDPSDDSEPTSVTFVESPSLGLAKSLQSGPVSNGDGTYTLSYRFHVSNSGDTRVDGLQIEDDFANAFAGVTAFAIDAISSSRLTVDPTFDGNVQRNLLTGTDSLNAGDGGTVDVTLVVTPGSALGPYDNSAVSSAMSAAGTVLTDTSTSGVTPDANGNGDPSDDSEPTSVTFVERPGLGLAKSVGSPVSNGDGTYTLQYSLTIENSGDVQLTQVQVEDDLTATFAGAEAFVVDAVTSTSFAINPGFDGVGDKNLLTGSAALNTGAGGTLGMTVTVTPGNNLGPYDNVAAATAWSPVGSPVSDNSTTGTVPDANGDGDPNNDSVPTSVSFSELPQLGASKEIVAEVVNHGDGTYSMIYRVTVVNSGDVLLENVRITDDLQATFAGAAGIEVDAVTSPDLSVNPGYDGASDIELLSGTDAFVTSASGQVTIAVTITPGAVLGPYDNVAVAHATTAGGVPISDTSSAGNVPDANGNGDPGDDAEPTSVVFAEAPLVGIAKQLAAGPVNNADGTYTLGYSLYVENTGDARLEQVQVIDDLSATFSSAQGFVVDAATSSEFPINPGFDGALDTQLLAGNAFLDAGTSGSVMLTVTVQPGANLGPFLNNATAQATSAGGTALSDASVDGVQPDANGDGDPGNDTSPTAVAFAESPQLGAALEVASGPTGNGDGTYNLVLRAWVENSGDVPLSGLLAVHDLASTFAGVAAFEVGGTTSPDLSVNPSFDGALDLNLLSGTDALATGTRTFIDVTVHVTPGANLGPYASSLDVSASSPAQMNLSDTSTEGGEPDANGNGDPGDDATQTTIAFTEAPRIGVAKEIVTGPTNHGDGTYSLTYRIHVENTGDVRLENLKVSEDLGATFAAAVSHTALFATSSEFTLNPGYDGTSDTDLLIGWDALAVGERGAIDIAVNVRPGTMLGPYDNQADANATSPAGALVMDLSTDGTNVDPNANGDPSDDAVPTSHTFVETAQIGAAKSVLSGPVNNGDGTYALSYRMTVANSGDVTLHGVQIADSLQTTFVGATAIVVDAVTSSGLTVNPLFDGITSVQLLLGNDELTPGTTATLDLALTIAPGANLGPHANRATAFGSSPAGALTVDISTDGVDPDPTANGDPGDDQIPTTVSFSEQPGLGVAKSIVAGPESRGDGTYSLTYRVHVENIGDVLLENVQVTDDLAVTFAAADRFSVGGKSANGLSVNPWFNGSTDKNLLLNSSSLPAGVQATVDFVVNVTPGTHLGPYDNTATGTAMSAAGTAVADVSTSGSVADANGNGDPSDDNVPTSVSFTESPQIGVAKSVALGPTNNGDGTYSMTYGVVVLNMGDVPVTGLQVTDDLGTALAGAVGFQVDGVSSTELAVDPAFDGLTRNDLLDGNDTLLAGESGSIQIAITVTPGAQLGSYLNQASAVATSTGGTPVSDLSTAGVDPDPNGNGNPNDDFEPTPVTFSEAPQMGLAKSVLTSPANNGDGSYTLSYRIMLVNSGDALLSDLRVQDDLSTSFATADDFIVHTVTSESLSINLGYDGRNDTELLSGTDVLVAGSSAYVDIMLTVIPGTDLGPYDNQAMGTASSAAGTLVSDLSTLGSLPDANLNGDPGDDSTPTSLTFGESPQIGVAKTISAGPTNEGDGTYTLTYRVMIQNSGDVPLHDVQVVDDLATTFGGVPVTVEAVAATGLNANPAFDGTTDTNLLAGTDTLDPAGTAAIDFSVRVTPGASLGPHDNVASANALSAGGASVADASTFGFVPDANGNGDPGDDSTPTPVTFEESPEIGVAKALLATPLNNGDGTYRLTFRVRVENTGDVPVAALQLTDDLSATFAGAVFSVDSLTSAELDVNPGYDGGTDTGLLIGTDTLPAGASAAVDLVVSVVPGTNLGPYSNAATGTATSVGGAALSDLSTDGELIDANGNGFPGDDSAPTQIVFSEAPQLGVAKSIVAGPAGGGDGSYALTFRIAVENGGDVPLRNVQIQDDLQAALAGTTEFSVESLSSAGFSINPAYDGIIERDLLLGADSLSAGARASVDMALTVTPGANLGPYANQASAVGRSSGGTLLFDASANGIDPDADGDGDPTNDGTPTPIVFTEDPHIGAAQRVSSGPLNNGDGTYTLTYEIVVDNAGDVVLDDIQVTSDLAAAYAEASTFSVQSVASTDFSLNTGFDGAGTTALLDGSDMLPPGVSGRLEITVNVTPGTNLGPYDSQVAVQAHSPSGTLYTDTSTDGPTPDANGNGDASDDTTPTRVSFSEAPQVGSAKSLAAGPTNNGDGTYGLTYRMRIENSGDARIENVQLLDDLSAAFAGASDVSVDRLESATLSVNPGFEGKTDVQLLSGTDALTAGEVAELELEITVTPGAVLGPFANGAELHAVSAGGAALTDLSTDGLVPDANGNGDPGDDGAPTLVTFSESPQIGVAKTLLDTPTNNGDGTYTLTYRLRVENGGDVAVDNLQLVDDLGAAFAAAVSVTVDDVTSTDFALDPTYDGITNTSTLASGAALASSAVGSVDVTVTVTPGFTAGPYDNSATATALSPADASLLDLSTTGAVADADGDGDPSNDQTPTRVSFDEAPEIGVAKAIVSGPTNNGDGSYSLTYRIVVENSGDVPLNAVQIRDDLATAYASAASMSLDAVTSSDLQVNASYDGAADTALLGGAETLAPGTSASVQIGVTVIPGAMLGPYDNVAVAQATSAGGSVLSDISTDGVEPDADGDGSPSNDAAPTRVSFGEEPEIGIAKAIVSGPTNNADGTYSLTYRLIVENRGDVPVHDVQVRDDLASTFAGVTAIAVDAVTSGDLQINTTYDGISDSNLLAGSDTLAPSTSAQLELALTVTPGAALGPHDNVAVLQATSVGGRFLTDDSTDGSDPDADGDGDPYNDNTPTGVSFGEEPEIGIAKAIVSGPTNNADGTYALTYRLVVENRGDVPMHGVQIRDDLASTFAGVTAIAVDAVTSDLQLNLAYDGTSDSNLLSGDDTLGPGAAAQLELSLTVTPGAALGPHDNVAVLQATSVGGRFLTDDSTDGSDPDADGDGDPYDDNTPTRVTLSEEPNGGIAKAVVSGPDNNGDGTHTLTYRITLENSGDVELRDVQILDDLSTTFAGAGSFVVNAVSSQNLTVNPSYDGSSDFNLLGGGDVLAAGGQATLELAMTVTPDGNFGPFDNQATLRAQSPAGTLLNDLSTDGFVADADGDGDPGNDTLPTRIFVGENPRLGLAKALTAGPTNNGDGTYGLTYTILVENSGDVVLHELQVYDDLQVVFADAATFVVNAVRSLDFKVDTAYDGNSISGLLVGTDRLGPGASGTIEVTLTVAPGAMLGPYLNTARGTGRTPGGNTLSDISTDGAIPDADGDGHAGNDESPTRVSFSEAPQLGLAKDVVAGPLDRGDGSYAVSYVLYVSNTGDVRVANLALSDSLATRFGAAESFSVAGLSSTTLSTNPTYDGMTNVELLGNGNELAPGETASVQLDLIVVPGAMTGPYANQAWARATTPATVQVVDASTAGPDMDANGNGDPADDSLPTVITFDTRSRIGLAMALASSPVGLGDGRYRATYVLRVENIGDATLRDVQIVDDLATTFAAADGFVVEAIRSTELVPNPAFDGSATTTLLGGTDSLSAGAAASVEFDILVTPGTHLGPYENSAIVRASNPDGGLTQDVSIDGTQVDANGNGDANDDTGATAVTFVETPQLGLAKAIAAPPELQPDGSWSASYELIVANTGDVTLHDVRITDDLRVTFSGAADFRVDSIVSERFAINPGYDGRTDLELLAGSDSLTAGAQGSVTLHVAVRLADSAGPFLNSAAASATSPAHKPVADVSTAGTEPDANGDGDPGDDQNPTALAFPVQEASLLLGKSADRKRVTPGELVRYTLLVENLGPSLETGIVLQDWIPAGFQFAAGSAQLRREGTAPQPLDVTGARPLVFEALDLAGGETVQIQYVLRVGSGVGLGEHVNQLNALQNGVPVGNTASASVERVLDPTLESTTILGKVFHDLNGDGWQDAADATDVRVRIDSDAVTCVPNTTQLDRGTGFELVADVHGRSVLRSGLRLGDLPGRTPRDMGAPHFVIRVGLRSPGLPPIVVTTSEGSVLQLEADGTLRTQHRGAKKRGTTGQELVVSRRIEKDGARRTLILEIENRGSDESGIPGVRLVTATGLVIHTDAEGRYHLAGVDAGEGSLGRNFILKVDTASLPESAAFSTENPRVLHLTAGLMNRIDFGVVTGGALTPEPTRVRAQSHLKFRKTMRPAVVTPLWDVEQVATFVLGHDSFKPGSADLTAAAKKRIAKLAQRFKSDARAHAVIEGHTDDIPVRTLLFQDNYDLSIARARAVLYELIVRHGVAAHRLSALGFGPDRPIEPAKTRAARRKNRRVEVKVSSGNPEAPVVLDVAPHEVDLELQLRLGGDVPIERLTLSDILPRGSEYVVDSARLGARPVEPRIETDVAERTTLRWTAEAPLADSMLTLTYRARIVRVKPTREMVGEAFVGWRTADGDSGASPAVRVPLRLRETAPKQTQHFTLDSESFLIGTSELTRIGLAGLHDVQQAMQEHASIHVVIEGHTETEALVREKGSRTALQLSEARARVVQKMLQDVTGFTDDTFEVRGYGSTRPVDSNFTLMGRQRNRRVEIYVHGAAATDATAMADSTQAQEASAHVEVPIQGYRSRTVRAAGQRLRSRTADERGTARDESARAGDAEGSGGSEDPVPEAAKPVASGAPGVLQLPWGGSVWLVEDARHIEPRLRVAVPSDVRVSADGGVAPTTLRISTNYGAFIERWELALYRGADDDHTRPLRTWSGAALRDNAALTWDGELDGVAPVAGDELVAVLRAWDDQGHMDETYPERMRVVRAGTRRDDDRHDGDARRDIQPRSGDSAPRLQAIPLRGALVRVQGSAIPDNIKMKLSGEPLALDRDGGFAVERLVPIGPQQLSLSATNATGEEWAGLLDLDVDDSHFFLVGIADLGMGDASISGNSEIPTSDPLGDGAFYGTGRLAFYLKGLWNGKYRATAHLDTREEEFEHLGDTIGRKDPRRLFRHLDPDRHFLTYGDGSITQTDVDTQGRFYARLDWDRSRLLWGNYATGLTGSEFAQYNRSLYGGLLHHRSLRATSRGEARVDATAFVSEAQTALAHNEFLGTGGSLYYLEHGDVVEGSDKIWVEVRDRDSDRVLQNVTLQRERDYEIDELQGRVLLRRPLMQVSDPLAPAIIRDQPLDGNRVLLLVDYEYVPDGFDADQATYGGRARVWATDAVALGGTVVQETRDGHDYQLAGGEVALQAGRGTYLKAELAASDAAQATSSVFSTDGGMTFEEMALTDSEADATAALASSSDESGTAISLEGRADLGEALRRESVPTLAAWWKRREAGFSTARLATPHDHESFGAELAWTASKRLSFGSRWSVVDEKDVRVDRRFSLQGDYRVRRWQLGAEVRDTRSQGASVADTTGTGFLGAGTLDGTVGGLRVGLDVRPGVNVYARGQATLRSADEAGDNHFGSAGVRARLGQRLELDAEAGAGTRGNAAALRADVNVSPEQELFGTWTLSTDRIDGERNVFSIGQRRTLSNQMRVFSEHQFTHSERQRGRTQSFGLDFTPRRGWSLGASLQRSRLDDDAQGQLDRDALSLTLGTQRPGVRVSLKGELRNDEGTQLRRQWLTTNRVDLGLSPDWTVLGKLSYARTVDRNFDTNLGSFLESGVGLAYRPVHHNRWNGLARYTFLSDLPVEGQSTRTDERSQVGSLDLGYDVHRRIELGGRYALKLQELRADRDSGAWNESRLDLAIVRVRFHLLRKLDAVGEYRWLRNDQNQDTESGALLAVYQHLAANFKIGAGFNATSFSDDLTQLDYDSYGWFLRLIGKY